MGKMTFSDFIRDVVSRKFQKRLQDLLKKIHPLSVCEIRAFNLVIDTKNSGATEAKEPVAATA